MHDGSVELGWVVVVLVVVMVMANTSSIGKIGLENERESG